jgi:hypothetical protein
MNEPPRRPDVRQAEDIIPWGRVFVGALVALAISAVLIFVAWREVNTKEAALRPSGIFPEAHIGPRRSVAEVQADLFDEKAFGQALNAKKHRELSTFGWVDRERRRIRIPIDQAMGLVVEENHR